MVARRTRAAQAQTDDEFTVLDPLAEAVFIDTQGVAGDLSEVLSALAGYDSSSIKGVLFRKPASGLGPFEWLEEVAAPIDMSAIMASLKSRWGGGKYRLQIFAGNKTRKVVEFAIAGDTKTAPANPMMEGGGIIQMMMLMNQQQQASQAEARREQGEMQRFMMQQQDAAAARQSSMITALAAAALPALIPILSGANREKLSDLLGIMQNGKGGTSLKETVETIVLLKGLTKDDDKSDFDPSDMMGSIMRGAGPALGAIGKAFSGQRQQPQLEAPQDQAGDGGLYLPTDTGTPQLPPPPELPAAGRDPVLALIRPHVNYFFAANHQPDLAADAVMDIIVRAQVPEDHINALVAAFAISGENWLGDLAAQGIDLRSNPEWAGQFLEELVARFADRDGDDGYSTGTGRRAPDAAGDARPGAGGVAGDAGAEAGV